MDEILTSEILSLLNEALELLDTNKIQARELQDQEEYDRFQSAIENVDDAIETLLS